DPPGHTKARAIISRLLAPASVQRFREGVYRSAVEGLERGLQPEEFDGVGDHGVRCALKVFPDAVGLSQHGPERPLAGSDVVFSTIGPKNEFYHASMARAAEVIPWITKNCERSELTTDGLGADVYKFADAGEITQEEAALLVRSFLTAGVDST